MAPVAVDALKTDPDSAGSASKRPSISPGPATEMKLEAHSSASPSRSSPSLPVASTSKHTLEESEEEEAARLFPGATGPTPYKKRVWVPSKHLSEPPCPPQSDPKTVQELAAQQAATLLGYEGRRIKKFMQRRTVDYWGALPAYRYRTLTKTNSRPVDALKGMLYPSPHQIVGMLPATAYDNLATSIATQLIHTSTNKIRCPINTVVWMPDGRRVLTGSTSGEFTLWNGLTFNFETIMQAHDSAVRSFAWSKSGRFLISSDQNGTIKYFQNNLNTLQAFQAHTDSVRSLSWGPDDSKFVSGADDSTMKIWDFDSAREIRTLEGHGWDVKCVDWHPTKGLLVSGSKDNLVKFWDPRTATCLATFHGHKNTVQASHFSPDCNLVATASRDQTVKVYDLRNMAELVTLRGHGKEVCSLDFHPTHHNLMCSGGSEGSILFWDLSSCASHGIEATGGGVQTTLNGESRFGSASMLLERMETAHESNVWSLKWHPLGHILCSGSNDHMTRFWSRARPDASVAQPHTQDAGVGFGGTYPNMQTGGNARWINTAETDDFVIPGLGNKSFIPTQAPGAATGANQTPGPTLNTVQPVDTNGDDFAIPGLSYGATPQAPPPQWQQQQQQPYQLQNQQQPWQPYTRQQPPTGGTYGAFY